MAHQIEGNYAFFGDKLPAWHGIGHVLKDAPTPEKAWSLAYPHNLFQYDISAKMPDGNGGAFYHDAPGYSAIVRDDGKVLGIHSDKYGLTQPFEVFKRFEPLIDSGLVELHAGGSLCEGRKMWALAKIKGGDADILPNDTIRAYLLFQTSFDGSCVAGAGFTGVRVVCANTLAMAQNDVTFRTKHTKNVNRRLDAYRDDVAQTLLAFRENVENMRTLARKQVTRASQETYIRHVIVGPEPKEAPREISTKLENKVAEVVELLDTQKGLKDLPKMRGTAWQAYNAVTEYITHKAGRTVDSRVDSQWFGANARLNQTALDLALAL